MTTKLLKNDFIDRLGLEWPLVQAPLSGGPSTPELVAAASNAGGLGSLGAAYLSPEELEKAILRIKSLTNKPFAVNLFVPAPTPKITPAQIQAAITSTKVYRTELGLPEPTVQSPYQMDFQQQFAVILKHRPAVFSFVFGLLDNDIITECKKHGIVTIGTATNVEEGVALQKTGVDAVVAQGIEAGGHRGLFTPDQADPLLGTFALTRLMANTLKIPVIAAGGIMDGKGIAAALMLGAQAAQLGTAFLTCEEAGTSPAYRQALLNPQAKTTRFTRAFSGRWARGLENRFMLEIEKQNDTVLPFPAQNSFTRDIRKKAAELGRAEFLSLWAGQGVQLIRTMKAADLMQTLHDETLAVFRYP